MKSSRNRSRSKGNRNRSVGNIVNRVFDSSGPEGKVRGTPQQIIDKYNQLTRDAQLSNDRVAAENFQQHAEHYLRMLSEAQREQEARREQQNQQNQQKQDQQKSQGGNGSGNQSDKSSEAQHGSNDAATEAKDGASETNKPQPERKGEFDTVIDGDKPADAGLVQTPENTKPAPKPTRSRSRKSSTPKSAKPDKSEDASSSDDAGGPDNTPPQEAAE